MLDVVPFFYFFFFLIATCLKTPPLLLLWPVLLTSYHTSVCVSSSPYATPPLHPPPSPSSSSTWLSDGMVSMELFLLRPGLVFPPVSVSVSSLHAAGWCCSRPGSPYVHCTDRSGGRVNGTSLWKGSCDTASESQVETCDFLWFVSVCVQRNQAGSRILTGSFLDLDFVFLSFSVIIHLFSV